MFVSCSVLWEGCLQNHTYSSCCLLWLVVSGLAELEQYVALSRWQVTDCEFLWGKHHMRQPFCNPPCAQKNIPNKLSLAFLQNSSPFYTSPLPPLLPLLDGLFLRSPHVMGWEGVSLFARWKQKRLPSSAATPSKQVQQHQNMISVCFAFRRRGEGRQRSNMVVVLWSVFLSLRCFSTRARKCHAIPA